MGSSSNPSLSVIFAVQPSIGLPTVPSRASIALPGTWREGGTFAATKGESSVAPYASRGRTPNFSSNASVTSVVRFSAAPKTTSSV